MFLVRLLLVLWASNWCAAHPMDAITFRRNPLLGMLLNVLQLSFDDEAKVCHTEACKVTADSIASSIDKSVDPCEDFYSFACNGWIEKHPIPPMSNQRNQFNVLNDRLDERLREMLSEGEKDDDEEIVKATKRVYEACMDDESIEKRNVGPLLNLLDEFNGWSVVASDFSFFVPNAKVDWQRSAFLVTKRIGITPMLSVGVDVDLRNTSRNVIIVEQPQLDIPAYFFSDNTFVKQYMAFFVKIVLMLRKRKKLPSQVMGLHHHMRGVVHFEMGLKFLVKKKEEMRDLEKFHNSVTVGELQEWTDNRKYTRTTSRIDWKRYLKGLLDKDDSEINDSTPVVVSDWEFLGEVLDLIDKTNPEVVNDYILWEVVKVMGRATNKRMRDLEFKFKSEVSGVTEDVPRWQECVQATGYMTFSIGYMYVKKHFSDEAKAKAIEMVENIRREFRKELSQVAWIDERTKKAALDKADFMNHFIGYPNWYANGTALEEYYKGLEIGKDHFDNILAIRQFLARSYLSKLDKKPSRGEWATGPAVVNAYYDPRMNSIIFPAGILDTPFFNKDLPEALNYGSIGSVIGHEITHAFDDVGRQVDKHGNIHQWWTKETEETYLKNARCFVEEYGNFTFLVGDGSTDVELNINGLMTLGENIADNGGLETSLRAYLNSARHDSDERLPNLEEYTPDHLFYIAFAMTWCETSSPESLSSEMMEDSHSPHMARVLGSLYNSRHFAGTWGCRTGSQMNPEKKCQVW